MSREAILPPEIIARFGYLDYSYQRGPNEISSACPKCGISEHTGPGEPDRFRIFTDGKLRFWCRHCGFQGFADDNKKEFSITPEMRSAWIRERDEREKKELEKSMCAIDLLRKEGAWLRYHENMGTAGREFWQSKGIPDWAVNYYHLGWCYDRVIWNGDKEYHTPTATIPIFAPGWDLVNLRHRLVNPPDAGSKYRPDRKGIPAALYLSNPDAKPSGQCIILEGEIKTIVTACYLDDATLPVVGTPGKNPNPDTLKLLDECDRIWIVLDPDAYRQAVEMARTLGTKRARVVRLPVKPDDAFTMYGATKQDFVAALHSGRVVV